MSYYDSNARRTSRGMAGPQWVGAQIDAGLRAHMHRVYGYMAGGLALTGIVAYGAAASGFYQAIAATLDLDCHAGAARLRPGPELRHPANERRNGDGAVLDLCRRHGAVTGEHLPGVHRDLDCARILYHC